MTVLIKDKARFDAESFLQDNWTDGFPVDAERIARAIGMTVRRLPLTDGISGMLRVNPNDIPEIFIDAADVPQRQRFTIAHEIGHYFERTDQGELDFNFIDYRGTGNYDVHEFYADEFAGNLLMPASDVEEQHAAGLNLARLAHRYGVSLQAMRLRMRRLDLAS